MTKRYNGFQIPPRPANYVVTCRTCKREAFSTNNYGECKVCSPVSNREPSTEGLVSYKIGDKGPL